ncbi:hypothetical protein BGW36DRAFT_462918 [Talaromyces proteolyticus]|uniref:Uncharacterized protein n=1 Tax=Talaromyces proteolyticus TaxID=1131652 RepID=A0AAD4KL85_9EURO|nr:uncharacterized protein BGW36DRAFT_462918 [Talaromyces proteolyticus]KAH8695313.1 hypothetical protein BGW36DRAFT_462918 [Talaromyces proteolyticus]
MPEPGPLANNDYRDWRTRGGGPLSPLSLAIEPTSQVFYTTWDGVPNINLYIRNFRPIDTSEARDTGSIRVFRNVQSIFELSLLGSLNYTTYCRLQRNFNSMSALFYSFYDFWAIFWIVQDHCLRKMWYMLDQEDLARGIDWVFLNDARTARTDVAVMVFLWAIDSFYMHHETLSMKEGLSDGLRILLPGSFDRHVWH